MYGYFCIRFIDFMLKVKDRLYNLYKSRKLHFTNLFSRNNYEKNDNTKIFPATKKMKKLYCVICSKYRKFEKPKISYLLEKMFFLLFAVTTRMKMEKYLKKKHQLKY